MGAHLLSVALVAQVVFHLTQQRLQGVCADAQRHTGHQNINDHQVQQARDHGAVAVKAFWVVGAEVDVAFAGQGRAAGGNDDGGGVVFAGNLHRVHQIARAARVADDHYPVAGPCASQGLRIDTPDDWKSATLRVTMVIP